MFLTSAKLYTEINRAYALGQNTQNLWNTNPCANTNYNKCNKNSGVLNLHWPIHPASVSWTSIELIRGWLFPPLRFGVLKILAYNRDQFHYNKNFGLWCGRGFSNQKLSFLNTGGETLSASPDIKWKVQWPWSSWPLALKEGTEIGCLAFLRSSYIAMVLFVCLSLRQLSPDHFRH